MTNIAFMGGRKPRYRVPYRKTAEVITLDVSTVLDIPASRVLDEATNANLDTVVVVGWTDDGEFYYAGSMSDGPTALWLLSLAKKKLLDIGDVDA